MAMFQADGKLTVLTGNQRVPQLFTAKSTTPGGALALVMESVLAAAAAANPNVNGPLRAIALGVTIGCARIS